jgi:hypothetical protein
MNIGSLNKETLINIGIVLVILYLCFNDKFEHFGSYKASCDNLPKAVKYALEQRKMNKVGDDTWDYYLPCGYTRCEANIKAFNNLKTGKKIFMIDGCDWIASKSGLWSLLKEEWGNYAHYIMPETFILSSRDERNKFKTFYKKQKSENKGCKFILKNYKQRQEGLKLSNDLSTILNSVGDGFNIVQDFLENPYIISGRKINIRYYLLVVCHKGNIKAWIYRDGFMYYTPKFFEKNSMDFKKTITTGYIDRKVYDENPLTLKDFRNHLGKVKANKFDEEVRLKMKATMTALSKRICSNNKLDKHLRFQIFGADIAPDENLNCTLMEINKGPDIGFKDKRDGDVKKQMVKDAFTVIDPIKGDTKHEFERIF